MQDWQPYPVDPFSCLAICVTIHERINYSVIILGSIIFLGLFSVFCWEVGGVIKICISTVFFHVVRFLILEGKLFQTFHFFNVYWVE